jgi:hypothetical protein
MTALTIKTQSFFRSLFEAFLIGRQAKANYEVARMLHREFPGESFDYVLRAVVEGKIEELQR